MHLGFGVFPRLIFDERLVATILGIPAMSPAATATPDTAVLDRDIVPVDRRQYASDLATCGSIVPSDR
jgi:hypothetical protein